MSTSTTVQSNPSAWFFSLRSKVIVASLAIVLSVLCTRLVLIYHAANQQHADDGAREVLRLNASLQTLLERSQQHLEDFATQIDWFTYRHDPTSLSQLYFSGIESPRSQRFLLSCLILKLSLSAKRDFLPALMSSSL